MNLPRLICPVLCLVLLLNTAVPAFETDQYNLPPVPLADIGEEVSDHVERQLFAALAKINAEITSRAKCLENKAVGCLSAEIERSKLAQLRSEDAVASEFYNLLGKGSIFRSGFGRWMETHKFRGQPDRYKTSYAETIFALKPSVYATLSPTIRVYGSELGIDKLDHFFQQGHDYHERITRETAKGKSYAESVTAAIKWGQRTERTYFGLLASGVYSNADLYANYAGMKFYENLTRPIQIGGKTIPPMVQLNEGMWQINTSAVARRPIKPFMTDHMNEALNPSAFRFTLVRSVRREVKKHGCPDWLAAYPEMTKAALADRQRSLQKWTGEDYGYTKKDRIVSLADLCFPEARTPAVP